MRKLLVFAWCACAASPATRGAESPPPKEITEEAAAKEALPAPPPVGKKGVIARADLVPVIDRGLGVFLQRVEVMPRFLGGRFQGWRLVSFFPGDERFTGVDLRAGDVIQRVNGRSVEKPDEANELWQSLRAAPALEVELNRDGQPIRLRWPIEP